MKTLHFGLFENPQANDSGTATWRHPENQRYRFDQLDYWSELGQICEGAALDFLFLADAWGWAEINGSRPPICDLEGLDLPRLDPATVVSTLIPQTDALGLVITGSTLLEAPYSWARRMASIDQLSGGRLGWNVVTTGTAETAAAAFGRPMVAHDDRYDMADDFMEVVYQLWEGCWEPDAVLADQATRYADPAKVHRIDHDGPYFSSHGYGNSAYSPQGTPVLFQAGSSPRGRRFGGTHGECIFLGGSPDQLVESVRAIRAEAAQAGRDPRSLTVLAGYSFVTAPTREQAQRRYAEILDAQSPELTVASYAWFTGLDLASYDPQTPMEELHTELSQTQVARFAGKTVGDVLQSWHGTGVRGKASVGTPEEIADQMCALAERADLDGFLITPMIQPGSTLDFTERVLPILQARGVARTEYHERTLRERIAGRGQVQLPDSHPAARHRNWSPVPSRA